MSHFCKPISEFVLQEDHLLFYLIGDYYVDISLTLSNGRAAEDSIRYSDDLEDFETGEHITDILSGGSGTIIIVRTNIRDVKFFTSNLIPIDYSVNLRRQGKHRMYNNDNVIKCTKYPKLKYEI